MTSKLRKAFTEKATYLKLVCVCVWGGGVTLAETHSSGDMEPEEAISCS
jgi:hypothetical protein